MTIRPAAAADGPAVERLAQLDSRPTPAGRLLLAEVDGELVAARSLETGAVVADPFRPTAAIVRLLDLAAKELARSPARPAPRSRLSVA